MCKQFLKGRARDWVCYQKLFMENKKYGFASSSVDPQKLSLTIKGAIGFLVVVLGLFKIDIPQTDIDVLVESLLAVITATVALYGIYRKIVTWYKSRNTNDIDVT